MTTEIIHFRNAEKYIKNMREPTFSFNVNLLKIKLKLGYLNHHY